MFLIQSDTCIDTPRSSLSVFALVFGFRVQSLLVELLPSPGLAVAMPPRRRKTLSSPSSTIDSVPLSTTEQSLRSTPATSEADSEKPAPRRPTRSRAPIKATKKRVRESSDEGDPLAVEEDEEEPLQKVANRAIKRRAITNRAYVEVPVKKKPSVCFSRTLLAMRKFGAMC